ncbi:hypothetical protein QIS74_00324 [Colletotrichum tabaci]|uniref:Uncharacterized protein n=1 Tax=Colletotrichum tabaci TaxID=1209068 RepID=A0AAV9TXN3_9PEZI
MATEMLRWMHVDVADTVSLRALAKESDIGLLPVQSQPALVVIVTMTAALKETPGQPVTSSMFMIRQRIVDNRCMDAKPNPTTPGPGCTMVG